MAEIPERWRGHYACIVDGEVDDAQLEQQLMEELGTAEARIRELEQERDAALTKWQTCRALREVERVESSRTADSLQAKLQAVTQEREMAMTIALAEIAQLQARNRALRDGFARIIASSSVATGETDWALSVAYEMLAEAQEQPSLRAGQLSPRPYSLNQTR